ncbi:MAG: putative metal-dependent rane protease [Candidatus Eremiobacteraeota bacterium]|nr:putative metal-dependent rane protease [Candidatus Eremiobacteraeota bacterium]
MVKTSTSARSPLSPTLWPREAFAWWFSIGVFFVLALSQIVPAAIFVAVLLALRLATLADLKTLSWPIVLGQLAAYGVSLLLLTLLLPALAKRPLTSLGLRAPRATDLAWGLGGAAAMVVVATATGAVQDALFHLKPDEVQVHWLREARGTLVAGFVFLACIAAPFFEELTFRGFIFNAFLRYMPAWAAVALSALAFGFAHWQPGNAGAIAPLAAGGIVLATVYYRTGSLVASMITHAIFNSFTVVLVLVFHQI